MVREQKTLNKWKAVLREGGQMKSYGPLTHISRGGKKKKPVMGMAK